MEKRERKKSRTKITATTARQNGIENIKGHSYQASHYLKALATSPINQKNPMTAKVSGAGSRKRTKTEIKKK